MARLRNPAGGSLLASLACAVATACSHASAPAVDGSPDSGSDDATVGPVDASSDAGADVDAGPPQTFVRFAQLSPDAPALDFCLARHATATFDGPVLAQFESDAGLLVDGSAPGLSYPQVSTYVALTPGQYDVRVVAGGARSCSDVGPVDAGPATELPALSLGAYTTIVAAGEVATVGKDASFHLTALADDVTFPTVVNGGSAVRALNAVPSVAAVDFGFGSFAGGGWLPLFEDVAFGAASTRAAPGQGVPDGQGYLPIGDVAAQVLSVRPSTDAKADLAVAHDASIGSSSIATLVAIGGKTGDEAHPPALMLCVDNSGSGGLLADCSVLH